MNLFWLIRESGAVFGPWPSIGPALAARQVDADRIVSIAAADWTPQLAPSTH